MLFIKLIKKIKSSFSKKRGIRKFIGPKRIILAIFLIVIIHETLTPIWAAYLNPEVIYKLKQQHPLRALVTYMFSYSISVIALIPTLPFNLAGGFFWGGLWGGVLTSIAVTIGSWISFRLSRTLFGEALSARFESKWIYIVQEEFKRNDWAFIVLARLNPIIPTGPLNYLLGITSVGDFKFIIATFLSLLVPSIAVSYIGYSMQKFSVAGSEVSNQLEGLVIVSTAMSVLFLLRICLNIYGQSLPAKKDTFK